jgi:O-antigen ligase
VHETSDPELDCSVLKRIGFEDWIQPAITLCAFLLILVPTLKDPSTSAVFLTYRTLLIAIVTLSAIASHRRSDSISKIFLGFLSVWAVLSLVSIARIAGPHFDALSIFYRYLLFILGFLALAFYNRNVSARWKGILLAGVIVVDLAHLAPDLIRAQRPVAGFSSFNANYFGTFLLIGLAASIAAAIFSSTRVWRIAAALAAALLLYGVVQTGSRGAVLSAMAMVAVAAFRTRNRVPARVWMAAGLALVIVAVLTSPFLIRKFLDRGQIDPYNYARVQIWGVSLRLIADHPLLGVGPGEFFHLSKRFNYPVEGQVARYEKHVGIAHSEYLQQIAETGIPAGILLFSLFAYLIRVAWKRARTAAPEQRCFQEAAILAAAGVGAHSFVDNCWTVPVMASALVLFSLADLLPVERSSPELWTTARMVAAAAVAGFVYIQSTVIPATAIRYNAYGLQAYQRGELDTAETNLLEAVAIVPDYSSFLENLSKVYIAKFDKTQDRTFLERARACLETGIQATPQAVELYLRMEEVLIRSLTGDAQRDLAWHQQIVENDTKLLEVDPYLPFPRKNLAIAYYNLGQRQLAFEEMNKALEYEPNYVPAYAQLASWYGDQGDAAAKEKYASAAVSIVNRYRNFKPESPYQGILLGRPESEWRQ